MKATIKNQNPQLNLQTDQLEALLETNEKLKKQVIELTEAVSKSAAEMEDTNERMQLLKAAQTDAETRVAEVLKQNATLESKLSDSEARLAGHARSDDTLWESVNAQIESWKARLGEKDAQIAGMQQVISSLQQDIDHHSKDREEDLIAQVVQQEQEVAVLREQLQAASDALDAQTTQTASGAKPPDSSGVGLRDGEQTARCLQLEQKCADMERELAEMGDELQSVAAAKADVQHQLDAYVQGKEGLYDALQEIAALTTRMEALDRDVVAKTAEVTKLDWDNGELCEQLDELRSRLGLSADEPVSLTELRYRRKVEAEQLKAVNRVLEQDVQRLETERRVLKQRLLDQALDRAEQTVRAGGDTADLLTGEEFADHHLFADHVALVQQMGAMPTARGDASSVPRTVYDDLRRRCEQLVQGKNAPPPTASEGPSTAELIQENAVLRRALDELLATATEHAASGQQVVADTPVHADKGTSADASPAAVFAELRQLLRARTDTHASSDRMPESSAGDVLVLQGRHDELRATVAALQKQLHTALQEAARYKAEVTLVRREAVTQGRDTSESRAVLPAGLPPSSAAIIAALNEQLIEALHDADTKTADLRAAEQALDLATRELSVFAVQQSELYKQHAATVAEHDEKVKRLEASRQEVQLQLEQAQVYKQQLATAQQLLTADDDTVKQELSRALQQETVYKVNTAALTRKYTLLQADHSALETRLQRCRHELSSATGHVQERLNYLERCKVESDHVIRRLQRTLERSVDENALNHARKQCEALAAKLRQATGDEQAAVLQRLDAVEGRGGAADASPGPSVDELTLKLTQAEERERALTDTVAVLRARIGEGDVATDTVRTAALETQRVQTLQLQITHERQRGDLLGMQRDKEKQMAAAIEARNLELQAEVQRLTASNLQLQDTVRDLQDSVDRAVTAAVHAQVVAERDAAQDKCTALALEASQLKNVADIARQQTAMATRWDHDERQELIELRAWRADSEVQTDDDVALGALHRRVLSLHEAEHAAVRRLEEAGHERRRLEGQVVALEQTVDELRTLLHRARDDAKATAALLRSKLHALRLQFAGAVSLQDQEKTTDALKKHVAERAQAADDVAAARRERIAAEDAAAAMQLRHEQLQTLVVDVKQGRAGAKMVDWHQRMVEAQVAELQLRRQVERAEEHAAFLQQVADDGETRLLRAEADLVNATRDHVHRQMLWEEREDALEDRIDALESEREQQREEARALLGTLDVNVVWMPDANKDVAHQLDDAIHNINKLSRVLTERNRELTQLTDAKGALQTNMKKLEARVSEQESTITDLRLRYFDTAPPDDVASELQQHRRANDAAVAVANETISGLRALLTEKDVTIGKVRGLVAQTREQRSADAALHERVVAELSAKVRGLEMQRAADGAAPAVATGDDAGPMDVLQRQVMELENMIKEQEQKIHSLTEAHAQLQDAYDVQLRRVHSLEDELSVTKAEASRLHDNNIRLSERGDNFEQTFDAVEARLAAEQAKSTALADQTDLLRDRMQKLEATLQKRDAAIKRLKLQADSLSLKTGGGFGSTRTRTAGPTGAAASQRSGGDTDTVAKLRESLARAQDVAKKHRERLSDSEAQRRRAETELTAALQLIHGHEQQAETLGARVAQLSATVKTLKATCAAGDTANDELRATVLRLQKQLDAAETDGTTAAASLAELTALRKRVRVLESRGRDVSDAPTAPAEGGTAVAPGSDRAQWEADKRRQRHVERLKTRAAELTADLDAARAQAAQYRELVTKVEREKTALAKKLKRMDAVLMNADDAAAHPSGRTGRKDTHASSPPPSTDGATAKAAAADADAARSAAEALRKELLDKNARIETLELELAQMAARAEPIGAGGVDAAVAGMRNQLESEARRRLASEHAKISLAFELEQLRQKAQRGGPRGEGDRADGPSKPAGVSNTKYMALVKAHRELKAQVAATARAQAATTASHGAARLSAEVERLKQSLKREREAAAKMQQRLQAADAETAQLRATAGTGTDGRTRAEQENPALLAKYRDQLFPSAV
eukprot:m.1341579 g.1341579  ORF g.1341579 m.1341579 type:complete len:2038 (-) comp24895_c0_seq10:1492-7605(-)